MIFKRKIYDDLCQWKSESQGHTALLIEGARRIGKSTVAEEFARNEYKSYILIDFSKAPQEIRDLFDDLSDLNYLFLRLQLHYKTDLHERESLIVFDEVQLCPPARQAIKALVQDHRYDYIETGSLISIKRNVKDILIPSEERRINMFPMDYEEFLWALGDTTTYQLLKSSFESGRGIGDTLNREQMRRFRLYMLVGGMPQAVSTYLETNNFRPVDEIKRDILSLYEADFAKIDPTGRLSLLFDSIPAQLSKNTARFQPSSVLGSATADATLEMISQLKDSKTVLIAYHSNDPHAGLSVTRDLSRYKLFTCDTGLFVTLMFKDCNFTDNDIYEKLLSDKLPVNLGYLYENIVAQCLAAAGNELYYHTMFNEVSRHSYEVDFLLTRKSKIVPIEVKSSGYKAHKSLDVFTEKYPDRILRRYLIYTKDLRKDQDIYCIPVYMTAFI
jgi:uncharacterized protein